MAKVEKLEDILTLPVQLTDTVRRLASEAGSFKSECFELHGKAEKIAMLLRAVARLESNTGVPLYTRPLHRMLQELVKTLRKVLILVEKCKSKSTIRRVITITSTHDFKRVNVLLENSLADLSWFLSISAIGDNRTDGIGGMPPITSNEPLLGFCWEQIGLLHRGSDEERNDAVISLNGYAKNNERFMKMMVEEEVVPPLLKVLQDGTLEAREMTARTLGLMASDENVVKQMVACGVIPVSVKVLYNAPMKIQAAMAWAIAEMLHSDPSQQDLFFEESAVRSLVGLLGESLEDLEKTKPAVNMHTLMTTMAASKAASTSAPQQEYITSRVPKPSSTSNGYPKGDNFSRSQVAPVRPVELNRNMVGKPPDSGKGLSQRELNRRERDNADPSLKAELKAEVARALWKLATGNSKTCKSITETKALLCFATLMEKTSELVQYNSVMAVMEIASVAEDDVELRRAAFKTNSPAAKAVVDQLLRLVEEGSPSLQVACIRAIGSLSRTFPVRETRVVKPLVKQLEGPEEVVAAAVAALVKFVCKDNFLHKEHSKAVVDAAGASPLVQLIFLNKGDVQVNAVILMCNLALHSGESEALARAEPLPALKKFAKTSHVAQQPFLDNLVHQAINHLEIYHGRAPQDLQYVDAYGI
ncbi:hypothetical protein L7F22_022109 [Adiantum nelumboides]|nr:hypothetical protein [Adiantum nelumboides]